MWRLHGRKVVVLTWGGLMDMGKHYLPPTRLFKKYAMGNIKFILIFDKKFVKHGISGVILFNNGR